MNPNPKLLLSAVVLLATATLVYFTTDAWLGIGRRVVDPKQLKTRDALIYAACLSVVTIGWAWLWGEVPLLGTVAHSR